MFIYVIYFTQPPTSWTEASTWQILSFFIPLLCFLTFFINLFIKYLPKSFILGLGSMFLIVLKSIDSLNIFLGLIIVILTFIALRFYNSPSLTRETRIPKLKHLERRKQP